MWWLNLLLFPGIIFHELSHYIACIFAGVKVKKLKLSLDESFVAHESSIGSKSVLIATAPFLFGTILSLIFYYIGITAWVANDLLLIVWFWLGFSTAFHSFPSLDDTKNALSGIKGLFTQKVLNGNIFSAIFHLVIFCLFYVPLALIIILISVFNYSMALRALWAIILIGFAGF